MFLIPHSVRSTHAICVLQISSYFAEKLLRIVRDTILHMKGTGKSNPDQHTSSGKPHVNNNHLGDPALEFIKHVCAVLALDQNVQHDILVSTVSSILASYVFRKVCRKCFPSIYHVLLAL